jgi:hypothetical protein
MHQLGREAGRGPELGELPPGTGTVAGLLLELAPRGELGVLDRPRRLVDVERAGRDLEQQPLGRTPPLADEEELAVGVDGDDRDRSRMAGDVALGAAAVGPLDRVDPELEVVAAMEDPPLDDALGEVGVRRRAGRRRGRDRAGRAGPIGSLGQAATVSRSEVRLAPDSASKRWSFESGRVS